MSKHCLRKQFSVNKVMVLIIYEAAFVYSFIPTPVSMIFFDLGYKVCLERPQNR